MEVDGAVVVGVYFVDHVLQFGLWGVLAQRPHDRAQLLARNLPVAVFVEESERFPELRDLLVCERLGHVEQIGKMMEAFSST